MNDDTQAAAPRPIAVCRSYDDLRAAVAAYCADQHISHQDLDLGAELADGHASKLLSPRQRKGARVDRAIRGFGNRTLRAVLDYLELEIVVRRRGEAVLRDFPENDATGHTNERKPARQDWRRRRGVSWGKRMAALRTLLTTPEQRRASARKAAQTRWANARRLANPPTNPPREAANPHADLPTNPHVDDPQT